MQSGISQWMKVSILLVLSLIVALNLPLQINLVDSHETHATEATVQDSQPAKLATDCHVSGACSPMQLASLPSIIYVTLTMQFKPWRDAVSAPTAHLTSLETPPPRV